MKRLFVLIAVLLGIVLPSHAIAGTPYAIQWAAVQEAPECEHAHLAHQGDAMFDVNNAPIPTYEVANAFAVLPNGWETNLFAAGFDSVLLRTGANQFAFRAYNSGGQNSCVHSSNVVTLQAPTLGIEKLLFDVRRDGTAFSGSTQLDLTLEEINPQLAQNIAILEKEVASEREWLIKNAANIVNLDERLDA